MIATLVVSLALQQQAGAVPVLSLADALKDARERNLDLKAAQTKLDQAHEIAKKAWALYLPQVALGGSYTRNSVEAKLTLPTGYWLRDIGPFGKICVDRDDPTTCPNGPAMDTSKPYTLPPDTSNPPGTASETIMYPSGFAEMIIQRYDQLGAQLSVNQLLIAPALWPAIKNAYLAERVVKLGVESGERELLFAVAQLYYGAASLREAVAVQERLLETAQAHERDAEVKFNAGAAPKLLLLRSQIDRAKAEQDLRRTRNGYQSAKSALATLLDRPPDFEVERPGEWQFPSESGDLEDRAVRDRPDLRVARASLELAERNHQATKYKYAPSVAGSFVYRLANFKGFAGAYDTWALTFGLSWTIWDGGLRESELRENAAKTSEARYALRSAENKARDEVRRARLDLSSAVANRTTASEQLRLARENMALVDVNFKAGVATPIEVADAQAALRGAELGFVNETLNAQLASLRLAKAAGAFDPR